MTLLHSLLEMTLFQAVQNMHMNQKFTKNERDHLGSWMPFVMSPWPIRSVSNIIRQFHVKQFLILLKKAFPRYCHRS